MEEESVKIQLLTESERLMLSVVNDKLKVFENLVKTSIVNRSKKFTNCIILKGSPGIGKTHNITKWLNDLMETGDILDFNYYSGRVTPMGLFDVLELSQNENQVLFLDDCDVVNDQMSLNLLKAAVDTKSKQKPRVVTYVKGGFQREFEFKGYLIMTSNEDYSRHDNEHMKAVLDRVNFMELNITPKDIEIKNKSIIEETLNEIEDLDEETLFQFMAFYHKDIQDFLDYGAFQFCGVNFSVRYILKVLDLFLDFKESWTENSIEYKRLRAAADLFKVGELKDHVECFDDHPDWKTSKLPWKQFNGKWYLPKQHA